MNPDEYMLKMELDGTQMERQQFLHLIRAQVWTFTRRVMQLDALINEIAKNIYDHGGKRGYLEIHNCADRYPFVIRDYGGGKYNFSDCIGHSTKAGNGVNCNIGLRTILDMATSYKMILCIDTSNGFCYSGFYDPIKLGVRAKTDEELGKYAR